MIKVNELRVGNIINRGDYISRVIQISAIGAISELHIISKPLNYEGERFVELIAEPVPLTEEWLLKFGFKDNDGELTLLIDNLLYIGWVDDYAQLITEEGFTCGQNINHVHQLQNLYFALTNEELTIKEYAN